jgi:hypothetical protein
VWASGVRPWSYLIRARANGSGKFGDFLYDRAGVSHA